MRYIQCVGFGTQNNGCNNNVEIFLFSHKKFIMIVRYRVCMSFLSLIEIPAKCYNARYASFSALFLLSVLFPMFSSVYFFHLGFLRSFFFIWIFIFCFRFSFSAFTLNALQIYSHSDMCNRDFQWTFGTAIVKPIVLGKETNVLCIMYEYIKLVWLRNETFTKRFGLFFCCCRTLIRILCELIALFLPQFKNIRRIVSSWCKYCVTERIKTQTIHKLNQWMRETIGWKENDI